MYSEPIRNYAREKGLSERDAAQAFMQVVVLKHLSVPGVRLMGGTALVLGHGNPRFSEDVDLTQVSDTLLLKPGLSKAAAEIGRWMGSPVSLKAPKGKGRTWQILCRLGRVESLRLHVDCQEYPAHTKHPIVIQFPSLPTFVCEAVALEEIMADKVIAVACRNYLGGRDLFDLWFHWLRIDDWRSSRFPVIQQYVGKKLKERSISFPEFLQRLQGRLSPVRSLDRAKVEWRRYLPAEFQRPVVQKEILSACGGLPEVFST